MRWPHQVSDATINATEASGNPMPRVMNVDKNPAYPAAVEALKAEGTIPRRVALRQCKYLNNVIEQDHRTVKKRVARRFLAAELRLSFVPDDEQRTWRCLSRSLTE
jgi:transposase-like protein